MKSEVESSRKSKKPHKLQYLEKIRSELWSHNILINCLQSQYTVRVRGYPNKTYYKSFVDLSWITESNHKRLVNSLFLELLSKEFGKDFKEKGLFYYPMERRIENHAHKKLFSGLKKIEKHLKNLPFEISYSFL